MKGVNYLQTGDLLSPHLPAFEARLLLCLVSWGQSRARGERTGVHVIHVCNLTRNREMSFADTREHVLARRRLQEDDDDDDDDLGLPPAPPLTFSKDYDSAGLGDEDMDDDGDDDDEDPYDFAGNQLMGSLLKMIGGGGGSDSGASPLHQLLMGNGNGPSPLLQLFGAAQLTPAQQAGCPSLNLAEDTSFQYLPPPPPDTLAMVDAMIRDESVTIETLLKSRSLFHVCAQAGQCNSEKVVQALRRHIPSIVNAMLLSEHTQAKDEGSSTEEGTKDDDEKAFLACKLLSGISVAFLDAEHTEGRRLTARDADGGDDTAKEESILVHLFLPIVERRAALKAARPCHYWGTIFTLLWTNREEAIARFMQNPHSLTLGGESVNASGLLKTLCEHIGDTSMKTALLQIISRSEDRFTGGGGDSKQGPGAMMMMATSARPPQLDVQLAAWLTRARLVTHLLGNFSSTRQGKGGEEEKENRNTTDAVKGSTDAAAASAADEIDEPLLEATCTVLCALCSSADPHDLSKNDPMPSSNPRDSMSLARMEDGFGSDSPSHSSSPTGVGGLGLYATLNPSQRSPWAHLSKQLEDPSLVRKLLQVALDEFVQHGASSSRPTHVLRVACRVLKQWRQTWHSKKSEGVGYQGGELVVVGKSLTKLPSPSASSADADGFEGDSAMTTESDATATTDTDSVAAGAAAASATATKASDPLPPLLKGALEAMVPLLQHLHSVSPATADKTSSDNFSRLHRAGLGRVAVMELGTALLDCVLCLDNYPEDGQAGDGDSAANLFAEGVVRMKLLPWTIECVFNFPGSSLLHTKATRLFSAAVLASICPGCEGLWIDLETNCKVVDKIIKGLACPEQSPVNSRCAGLGYRTPNAGKSSSENTEEDIAVEGQGKTGSGLIQRRQHQFKPDYCGHLYMWACVLVQANASVNKQPSAAETEAEQGGGSDADEAGDSDGAETETGTEDDDSRTIRRAAFEAGFNHPRIFTPHNNAIDFTATYGVNPVADFGFGPAAVKWQQNCTRTSEDHPAVAYPAPSHAIGTLCERIPEWKGFQESRLQELHNVYAFALPDTGSR